MIDLKTELTTDPTSVGYNLNDLVSVEKKINEKNKTRLKFFEIGNGGIITALGLQLGNNFIDLLNSAPEFRHIRNLLLDGRLRLDSVVTQTVLASLIGTNIGGVTFTQQHVDALNAPAKEDCSRANQLGYPYVDDFMIREALK